MKSTTGEHYIALDHVRAIAAFMVFTWHFIHSGYAVPFEVTPSVFPLAFLDEGHAGVSLFMVLSGYIFAKLLNGKTIRYPMFLWNRALRLLPLLTLVVCVVLVQKATQMESIQEYLRNIAWGVLLPTLPNGGWSITVEFQFYLLLPLLLWLLRKSKVLLLVAVFLAIALRSAIHHYRGEVQSLAYWTLVGRVDQFVLGILAFHLRGVIARRHVLALSLLTAFSLFYWWFDRAGGFYQMPEYPSPSQLWIVLPTVEAFGFAVAIAWYDNSFRHSRGLISTALSRIGEYSFSIYLLHWFFVHDMARFISQHTDLSNFYFACMWAGICFIPMIALGWASYRFIERPFLRYRRPYTRPATAASSSSGVPSASLLPQP